MTYINLQNVTQYPRRTVDFRLVPYLSHMLGEAMRFQAFTIIKGTLCLKTKLIKRLLTLMSFQTCVTSEHKR